MATVVSIPSLVSTGLRSLEYIFNMPSVGVAPEQKIFRYRLKNQTDNTYLTDWKYYIPVTDGQNIKIDFVKDLYGIITTTPPELKFPNTVFTSNNPIKKIAVEYGERLINTDTCADPIDTTDGTTNSIDVLNGIARVYQLPIPPSDPFVILSKRPSRYELNTGTYDWIDVIGTIQIDIAYYTEQIGLGTVTYNATGIHPGSVVTRIPIGFQFANPLATYFVVSSPQLVTVENPGGVLYTVTSNLCGCENGENRDIYFQNNMGGIDCISFDCVDVKQMQIAKQYITSKYNKLSSNIRKEGQRRAINNTSSPIITLRRQFEDITFLDSRWLDECAGTSNIWMRDTIEDGSDALIRMNINDGGVNTYEDNIELILQLTYSEEFIYPY